MRSFIFASVLAGCSLYAQTFDPAMPSQVPAVDGKVVEPFALRYIDITNGTGAAAAPGKQYTVHYTGWLRDGTKFDSSVDRKEPFKFVQNRRQVIAGWDVGFEGMRVGGKRRLFVPYELAYGEMGRGAIPPKAELIFDVELLDVKDVPDVPAAADLLLPFDDTQQKVIDLAKAIPEDKYGWRPGPGVRSFGEVFIHIALGNRLLLGLATEQLSKEELRKRIELQSKLESEKLTKAEIVGMLGESFAAVRKAMESARPAALGREADFFGTATTQRGILAVLDTHIAEHLGQAIAYARMNGIVPPWSRPPAK